MRGANGIWIAWAERRRGRLRVAAPSNPPTRREAERELGARLAALSRDGRRALVGFDFPFGYPAGLASALGCASGRPAWRALWQLLGDSIEDSEDNRSNRFEVASRLNRRLGRGPGPFWGCPPARADAQQRPTRRQVWDFPYATESGALARLRETDRRLPGVQEVWKLLGIGSVGSQALLGIPCVARLRRRATASRIWPFETGFTARPGPSVLLAEVWPGVFPLDAGRHPVRDAAQVLSGVRRLARLDRRGALGRLLAEPAGLGARQRRSCLEEEGWILGA